MVESFQLYLHTVRHLKPTQVICRLRNRLPRFRPSQLPAPPSRKVCDGKSWVAGVVKPQCWLEGRTFRFLHEARELSAPDSWNDPTCARLWLYNLHYFNYACQDRPPGSELLDRWIAENHPAKGTGWEPYPSSLRIVNWIKRHLAGEPLTAAQKDSLAQQIRWLRRNLEYHILGNHLLANAKALVFAGLFFEGREAQGWLGKGFEILEKEIDEQILPDGGHFERSPMYHGIILEDVLDLVNIMQLFGDYPAEQRLRRTANRMLGWMSVLLHPDGEIPFFNDSTLAIAPRYDLLAAYAKRLGVDAPADGSASSLLTPSGFARLGAGPFVLVADVGGIAPDYQPGHAHAETLSFELSVHKKRCLVNSGISCYAEGDERLRQRGSAAHNCLVVDNADSSEVWGSHRVARRARVTSRAMDNAAMTLVAGHDGYKRLGGVGEHRREWQVGPSSVTIADKVEGTGMHELRFLLHLHPRWNAVRMGQGISLTDGETQLWLDAAPELVWRIEATTYHPGFGLTEANQCVVGSGQVRLPVSLRSALMLNVEGN